MVNNLRDIPGDTGAGKRTLAVRLGDQRTRVLYIVLIVLPFVVVPFIAGLGGRPLAAVALVVVVLVHKPVLAGAAAAPRARPHPGARAPPVGCSWSIGVLLAVGLFLSA